jgi:hypothetical protein
MDMNDFASDNANGDSVVNGKDAVDFGSVDCFGGGGGRVGHAKRISQPLRFAKNYFQKSQKNPPVLTGGGF